MSAARFNRLVLVALAAVVVLHCALGAAALAAAGRLAWTAAAHHGPPAGPLAGTAARLGAAWLALSVVGLAVAARLVRTGRLSF